MKKVTPELLAEYLQANPIRILIEREAKPGDAELIWQRWLLESAPKRLIFHELYGDLLDSTGKRVLDVGGGLTTLTRGLHKRHDYEVLDLMAHADPRVADRFNAEAGKPYIHICDWFGFVPETPYDVILANDLFPNVDQRLELFIRKFLPCCRELRFSLTYYDEPKFYLARRIDAEEILCVLAWTGVQTRQTLEKFRESLVDGDPEDLTQTRPSIFPNNRQVCIVSLKASAASRIRTASS